MALRRVAMLIGAAAMALVMAPPAGAQSTFPGLQAAPPPAPAQDPLPAAAAVIPPLPYIDDSVAFNHAERWIIRDYFGQVREHQQRASRSKVYERALPAGLTQPAAKGDLLPAGIVAELRLLPGPLVRQLPPARPDTLRRLAGKDVLMLRAATGEVLDVLGGVIY